MRAEKLTLGFHFNTLEPDFVLQDVQSLLSGLGTPESGFQLHGMPLANLNEASSHLKRRGRATFNVKGNGYEFDLGKVRNCDLDFFLIRYWGEQDFAWDTWAAPFLASPAFVMAWVADADYDYWQNAHDPLQYKAANRPYKHLPMKSNGLPYPLEQLDIDTSHNPGRWSFRAGYYEAIGHVMWLGAPFWNLTGTDRTYVQNAEWLSRAHPVPEVLRIQAASTCFKSADGESGDLQRRLRALLFPNNGG